MPIFEYVCKQCHHEFETLIYGSQKAECPNCHGGKLDARLSLFAVSTKAPATTAPSVGACGSCGDPRGPGACSLGDLD
jgi:putative FmdB family regulatory protein